MKNVARVKWLSRLDMEPLLSAILGGGMLLSVGLLSASLWLGHASGAILEYGIHAISLPRLIQGDLRCSGSPGFAPHVLIDLGFAALLISPYARLVVTFLYLCLIKNRWKYAVYTGLTLVLLGIILFSDIVLSSGLTGILRSHP